MPSVTSTPPDASPFFQRWLFFSLFAGTALLAATGTGEAFRFTAERLGCLHPGRTARIYRGDTPCGWVGELHPLRLDLQQRQPLWRLDLHAGLPCPQVRHKILWRQQQVHALPAGLDDELRFRVLPSRNQQAGSHRHTVERAARFRPVSDIGHLARAHGPFAPFVCAITIPMALPDWRHETAA